MSSNLPPGVHESDIPGNRPEDQMYQSWYDGEVGDLLFELASLALPDVTDHRATRQASSGYWFCSRCGQWYDAEAELTNCQWPPYDVEDQIIAVLSAVKRDLSEAS